MPRICTSASYPIDFCIDCFPDEETAEAEYGDVNKTGSGPDDRGNCFCYDDEHPDYEETDYRCHSCRKKLTSEDNY